MTNKLRKSYQKYFASRPKKPQVLEFLRHFIPEIVFRTTRLEGEPVSRRNINLWLAGR